MTFVSELRCHLIIQAHKLLCCLTITMALTEILIRRAAVHSTVQFVRCKWSKGDTQRVYCRPSTNGFGLWSNSDDGVVPASNPALISSDPLTKVDTLFPSFVEAIFYMLKLTAMTSNCRRSTLAYISSHSSPSSSSQSSEKCMQRYMS